MLDIRHIPFDGKTVELRLEQRRQYLHASVYGPENSLASSIAYWAVLAEECERRGEKRLLVIDHLDGPAMQAEEMEKLVGHFADSILTRVRIAFVEPVAVHLPQMEHGQILAQELGYEARIFGGQHDAEHWLVYGGETEVRG